MVLFATIFAFGVQNIALARIEPTQASLILSLESVFGVVFSILLYGELLTVRLVVGFVLIFIALLVYRPARRFAAAHSKINPQA